MGSPLKIQGFCPVTTAPTTEYFAGGHFCDKTMINKRFEKAPQTPNKLQCQFVLIHSEEAARKEKTKTWLTIQTDLKLLFSK